MHNLHGGFSWNARPCSEMPSCLIEMQKDSARPREWAEGWQMGSCVDNWRMRNLGRRDPNQSPKTTGIWTVHSSKVKRFDSQYAPLSHVDIHNHPASKRSAFHRADWKGTSIKRPLKAKNSTPLTLTAVDHLMLEYPKSCFLSILTPWQQSGGRHRWNHC